MRRLVYSPKVYAYVQVENGDIIDLTKFIVRGRVSRVLNEVSTAELTIRNPGKQFTKAGDPTFRPMDPITIFMSRFPDRVIQVFTGYLDETPNLQLFPGTCDLRASCTLKRLMYTYFDPGLPFTLNFLAKYGWFQPAEGGGTVSHHPSELAQTSSNNPRLIDGALGNLMFSVLTEIGNWHPNSVMVEALPKTMVDTIASISTSFNRDDREARRQVEDLFSDLIGQYNGINAVVTGGTTSGETPTGTVGGAGPPSETIVSPVDVGRAMLTAGFPSDPQVIASGIETVEGESNFGHGCAADGWGINDYGCCAGYWQIYLSVHNVSMECANNLVCASEAAYNIWSPNRCFACLEGPNPWEGGTDSGTRYMSEAQEAIRLGPFESSGN